MSIVGMWKEGLVIVVVVVVVAMVFATSFLRARFVWSDDGLIGFYLSGIYQSSEKRFETVP